MGLKETFASPLSRLIGLSIVLAAGFLLSVLAGALYANWLPLISGAYLDVFEGAQH